MMRSWIGVATCMTCRQHSLVTILHELSCNVVVSCYYMSYPQKDIMQMIDDVHAVLDRKHYAGHDTSSPLLLKEEVNARNT